MSCHHRSHRPSSAPHPVAEDLSRGPDVRASDAEREGVVARLREHAAAGRLDVDELEGRVGAAYGARTRGDLAALVADLPAAMRRATSPARPARACNDTAHHLR